MLLLENTGTVNFAEYGTYEIIKIIICVNLHFLEGGWWAHCEPVLWDSEGRLLGVTFLPFKELVWETGWWYCQRILQPQTCWYMQFKCHIGITLCLCMLKSEVNVLLWLHPSRLSERSRASACVSGSGGTAGCCGPVETYTNGFRLHPPEDRAMGRGLSSCRWADLWYF